MNACLVVFVATVYTERGREAARTAAAAAAAADATDVSQAGCAAT